jgi:hypothetical protein
MNTPTVVTFAELDHWVGFDWAEEKHDVVAVDRDGKVVLTLTFPDTAEGWAQLREQLAPLGKVGVAIETSRGPAVDRLLQAGYTIFPMNPKAAERFRDRKAPSGVKDDTLDAWSFADALRTALVLQLRQALREYYPAALEAFDDWTLPSACEFVERFHAAPTGPGRLAALAEVPAHSLPVLPDDGGEAPGGFRPCERVRQSLGIGDDGQESAGRDDRQAVAHPASPTQGVSPADRTGVRRSSGQRHLRLASRRREKAGAAAVG